MKIEKFERPHVRRIVERVSQGTNPRLVAVTGPRQVGKTTIALQVRRRLLASNIPCWYIPMDAMDSHESDWDAIQETGSIMRTGSIANE